MRVVRPAEPSNAIDFEFDGKTRANGELGSPFLTAWLFLPIRPQQNLKNSAFELDASIPKVSLRQSN